VIILKNILVATDFSEAAHAALNYGKNFARAHAATLHVLHVADDLASRVTLSAGPMPDIGQLQMELETDALERLDALLTDEDRTVLKARAVVRTSSAPAQTIVSYARDAQVDLIIVGTHGRSGMAHFFMGSVAQHVVRTAPCPVLTVRHPEHEFIRADALQTVAAHRG
jgi:nucleotide-binding universal stress UspA family protein